MLCTIRSDPVKASWERGRDMTVIVAVVFYFESKEMLWVRFEINSHSEVAFVFMFEGCFDILFGGEV